MVSSSLSLISYEQYYSTGYFIEFFAYLELSIKVYIAYKIFYLLTIIWR